MTADFRAGAETAAPNGVKTGGNAAIFKPVLTLGVRLSLVAHVG